MTEIKKIVIEHYPVERLPADLRHGLQAQETVRLTIEPETVEPMKPRPLSQLFGCAQGLYATPDEATDFIRSLRDESGR